MHYNNDSRVSLRPCSLEACRWYECARASSPRNAEGNPKPQSRITACVITSPTGAEIRSTLSLQRALFTGNKKMENNVIYQFWSILKRVAASILLETFDLIRYEEANEFEEKNSCKFQIKFDNYLNWFKAIFT